MCHILSFTCNLFIFTQPNARVLCSMMAAAVMMMSRMKVVRSNRSLQCDDATLMIRIKDLIMQMMLLMMRFVIIVLILVILMMVLIKQ